MNRILFLWTALSFYLLLSTASYAQIGFNSPVGVPPTQDVEIYTRNGLLVQQKYQRVAGDPNASVTTMVNGANPPALTAVAGILKDPSGDIGYSAGTSYSAVQTITPSVSSSTVVAIELIFDDLDTEATNDYVSLTDGNGYEQRFSGNNPPVRLVTGGSGVTVRFITNTNSAVGRGFQLRWRTLVADNVSSPSPLATGSSLQFDVYRSSFQVGNGNHAIGYGSIALGYKNMAIGIVSNAFGYNNMASGSSSNVLGEFNTASGDNSTALGNGNTASGDGSSAFGISNTAIGDNSTVLGFRNVASGLASFAVSYSNTASGDYCFASGYKNAAITVGSSALGYNNLANGPYSSALGFSNIASGQASSALGQSNTASGNYSSALGNYVNTNGKKGAFMIGDSDPLNQGITSSSVTDQFVGRFLNGYYLLTCGDKNTGSGSRTGVQIGQGQNSWASISDSTKKERLLPIDYTQLLQKINAMRLTTWNYKGQRTIRHYGPMAQDFYAAFGQDGLGQVGCDTLIYSHDFAGVTFAGVQALIRENEALKARLVQQEARLQQAEQNARQANARLDALEAVLAPRRRVARR